jgi:hypothetical protein
MLKLAEATVYSDDPAAPLYLADVGPVKADSPAD